MNDFDKDQLNEAILTAEGHEQTILELKTRLEESERACAEIRYQLNARAPRTGAWEASCSLCFATTECGSLNHHKECPFSLALSSDAGKNYVPRAELEAAIRERDLAIAHDRQPYPTAHAYETLCKAHEELRETAKELAQSLNHLLHFVSRNCDELDGGIITRGSISTREWQLAKDALAAAKTKGLL